eukprot:5950025-Pyramimonas_sp.AAC.1
MEIGTRLESDWDRIVIGILSYCNRNPTGIQLEPNITGILLEFSWNPTIVRIIWGSYCKQNPTEAYRLHRDPVGFHKGSNRMP